MRQNLIAFLCVLLAFIVTVNCRAATERVEADSEVLAKNGARDSAEKAESKQLFVGASGKETSTPDFMRLVVMRLIYGLASRMGIEERLESAFNGVFVPPNADEGIFGGLGDGGGDDDLFGGLGDLLDY